MKYFNSCSLAIGFMHSIIEESKSLPSQSILGSVPKPDINSYRKVIHSKQRGRVPEQFSRGRIL